MLVVMGKRVNQFGKVQRIRIIIGAGMLVFNQEGKKKKRVAVLNLERCGGLESI